MSNQIALVSRTSIVALQGVAKTSMDNNDLSGFFRGLADAHEAAEIREQQFNRAMSGEFVTVTRIGNVLWEEHGVSLSAQNINNALIEMGMQTRTAPTTSFGQASYHITELARDLGAGMNVQTGQIGSVRWDKGIVMSIVDHVTKPEEEGVVANA